MMRRWIANWTVWFALNLGGMLVAFYAGLWGMALAIEVGMALPVAEAVPGNPILSLWTDLVGGACAGLVMGLTQSLALNYMRRGHLTRGVLNRSTAFWIGGTMLAGAAIWWVVNDGGADVLTPLWATGDLTGGLPAALLLSAAGLGAVLGALIGLLQYPALTHTPRTAALWVLLHIGICALAVQVCIAGLPAYDPQDNYARLFVFGALLQAVFLALGASVVLGGALLAWSVQPAPLSVHGATYAR